MIISRTPYRVSFFGGGTDYEPWYAAHGGAVLSTTIDKYCYLHCRPLPPFFDHHSRIVWSEIELVDDHAQIRHPVIRAVLDAHDVTEGVEIHHHGDLPARSGLGSSSAFTVGMLHTVHALRGRPVSGRELARQAIHIEREVLGEQVGVQDQISTAIGGLNRIAIATDGSFAVQPLLVSGERVRRLEAHLLLCYTGVSRNASAIAGEQIATIGERQAVLHRMAALVDDAERVLTTDAPLAEFGVLLHETWQLKRSLTARIAPGFVDEIYARARRAGALGGKLLGAGGGGFMLFFVPPADRAAVRAALGDLVQVPFAFESDGSRLLYHEPPPAQEPLPTARPTHPSWTVDTVEVRP